MEFKHPLFSDNVEQTPSADEDHVTQIWNAWNKWERDSLGSRLFHQVQLTFTCALLRPSAACHMLLVSCRVRTPVERFHMFLQLRELLWFLFKVLKGAVTHVRVKVALPYLSGMLSTRQCHDCFTFPDISLGLEDVLLDFLREKAKNCCSNDPF